MIVVRNASSLKQQNVFLMNTYDYYNREERSVCAHLFRLLHEKLQDKSASPLGQLLERLSNRKLIFKNGSSSLTNLPFDNIGIYFEAAIIRDAYSNAKPTINLFMDELTKLLVKQEAATDCRLFSQLPKPLNNSKLTHPRQIRQKASEEGVFLKEDESKVYGAMQGMFNAKPDLVITIDNILLVFEAKLTEEFDTKQLARTWNIAEVWSKLLFNDLGFSQPPIFSVVKLGASKFNSDINWKDIFEIVTLTYDENDRTRIAINAAVELLKRKGLE
ncbi:MAG: hypothetical protein HY960_09115 [Ignavibacteriae bacterium]|nr:hypothetical protein [Ignavibacteriota bacterium]